jgi:phosphonate degradation associated HDIG domain protein
MALSVAQILRLFETRGAAQYGGEAVSQLEHGLQCAALAAAAQAAPELVAASLLHDLGHLIADAPHENGRDADDVHQYLAIPFLRGVFPPSVLEPMRLHVDAKRFLCRATPGYWATLSLASKHSLEQQGGLFSPAEAERFLQRPFARDAVALRRWDDLAKVPGAPVPELASLARTLRIVAVMKPQ